MYIVKYGNTVIHNINGEILTNPKLMLEENQWGSFTFTINSKHSKYDLIKPFKENITILKNGKEIFSGRIIEEKTDILKQKSFYVEGELAYLLDSIQPPKKYQNATVISFLENLIRVHNSRTEEYKHFKLGNVTVKDPNDNVYRFTNWDNTLNCINDKLLKQYGGHLSIRKEKGVRYLDYLSDYPESKGKIELGSNLLDFSKNFKIEDLVTVLIPLGARIDGAENREEGLEPYVLIDRTRPYLENVEAIKEFGRIEKVVQWDNVNEPKILKTKAEKYLKETQFQNLALEVKAVDIKGELNFLEKVRVVSKLHGLDAYFPITKVEINLLEPANNTYTLGKLIKSTLTNNINIKQTEILEKIPDEAKIINKAKEHTEEVVDGAKEEINGTINNTKEELNGTINNTKEELNGEITSAKEEFKKGQEEIKASLRVSNGEILGEVENLKRSNGKEIESLRSTFRQTVGEITQTIEQNQRSNNNAIRNLQSSIRQTAEEIEHKVSKGEVESVIRQSADSIRLQATNITWDSQYSTMDKNGRFTAKKAKINGEITAYTTWRGGTSSYIHVGDNKITGGTSPTEDSSANWRQFGFLDLAPNYTDNWRRVVLQGNDSLYLKGGQEVKIITGGKLRMTIDNNGVSYIQDTYNGTVNIGGKYITVKNGLITNVR